MCGLAGMAVFGDEPLPECAEPLLRAMTHAVAHRGPDEQIVVREGNVGLGFTRLALVAPDAGDQPIRTPSWRSVLIANGEVYNHRELALGLASGAPMRTGSDCEVLAHLYEEYGREFLRHVNGMFAVVLYDLARRRLVLARDRFGIKPLYFHRNGERIVFASEIKALFTDPRTPRAIDWEGALASPALQSAPVLADGSPVSWFTGIEYVAPGTVVEIDLEDGRTSTYRYWEFPGNRPLLAGSDEELIREYGRLLAAAVADCATADSELGLFLSGGIDSAAVAAVAARTTNLHTFTILNSSTVESGDGYYADLVARRFGLPNHQVHVPRDHCPSPEGWQRFLWLMEHPMAGPEAYLKYELHRYARAARPGLKGMLLGAASDEFNGGYSTDYAGGGGWSSFLLGLSVMARRGEARENIAVTAWNETIGAPVLRTTRSARGCDDYLRYITNEYRKIHQYNVWHEDRSAAGSGIEARVPFLDHRLVELVTAIPPARRERLLWDKRILREAVRDLLPAEVVERQKVPFVHGEGVLHTQRMVVRLLTQQDRVLLRTALRTPAAQEYLNETAIGILVDGFVHGIGLESAELVLRLVNLALLDSMVARVPRAVVDLPAPPVLQAWPAPDFAAEGGAAIARQVHARADVAENCIVRWADGVDMLEATDGTRTRYIVIDGMVEYVVETEDVAWHRLVGQVDGVRTLGELMAAADVGYPQIADLLLMAVDIGVLDIGGESVGLTATEPPEHAPEPAAAMAGGR